MGHNKLHACGEHVLVTLEGGIMPPPKKKKEGCVAKIK
jgi:hypothetical protein